MHHECSDERLGAALDAAERRFAKANPLSGARHVRGCRTLPGGHTRQTLLCLPFPVTIVRGAGATLTDLDGHRYLDLVGDYAAGVYGHSCATIQQAAHEAIDRGFSYGAIGEQELELAELIASRIPSVEQVRFCNSGSEACLFSVLLARHATGRRKLLVFRGSYHGGFMIYADSDSPLNVPFDVVKTNFNDVETTRELIRQHAAHLAAVVVEPMMGAGGCIPASVDFLTMLRTETRNSGVLLIFDEVMTSRLSPGGLQSLYGITPDITALGKFWGGGFNFGAFGASRDLMRHFDTEAGGQLLQAGTFNNNVITMAAGLAGARGVYTEAACTRLNELGTWLRNKLNTLGTSAEVPLQVTGIGAVMTFHWHNRPINSPADTEPSTSLRRRLFQIEMMLAGFYVAQRGFTTLSLALTEADLEAFVDAVRHYLTNFRSLLTAKRTSPATINAD